MPFSEIRPTATVSDRVAAQPIMGAPTLNDPTIRLVSHRNGPLAGCAVWRKLSPTHAELGYVHSPVIGNRVYYRLIAVCVEQILAAGCTTGQFTTRNATLLAHLQTIFAISPQVVGTENGIPVEWRVYVDLDNALQQLAPVT